MDEKKFNRVEKKYLITKSQYDAIIQRIKQKMQEDQYYQSEIYNLYFDTDNYDLIIQSIDQPAFKEKLRARSYGGYDKVFLEIKTKIRGAAYRDEILDPDDLMKDVNLGYKRRVLITHHDFEMLRKGKNTVGDLAAQHIEQPADLQIAKEIDYMIKHFDLKPKILVYYNRESYRNEDGLRITFDTNLKYRNRSLKFHKKSIDKALFPDQNHIIMEVKANGGLPLWLVRTMSTEHVYPQRFSKIGKIYEQIRKEQNV
ncbi:polyphosphate polymerase domain-containing protein [Candidatus Saccharibacteria bacterium]|nr:polyphosphate polymerase domain-containing protein [Candidatus Saccharibacteria bacterium]